MDKEIRAIFQEAGFKPDWDLMERLRAAVVDGNRRMNLTRLTEPRDFYLKHVLDSVMPFLAVPALRDLGDDLLVADLGSGAGFPGLVLAHAFPGWRVALIERTQKKASFIDEVIESLGFENAHVVPFDAREAAARAAALRGSCDLVVARAVGRIQRVNEAATPLLKKEGRIVHYKGGMPDPKEIGEGKQAANRAGLKQLEKFGYDLPPDARRSIVLTRARPRKPH